MQILREEVIDIESPEVMGELIRKNNPEQMGFLIRDLMSCVKEGHQPQVSRFIGINLYQRSKKRTKIKILMRPRSEENEDIQVCKNWRKFAKKSLKLVE